jgi:PPOX class probable F420-dependent enzyme
MEIGTVIPPGHNGSFAVGARETDRTLADLPASHRALLDDPVTASMACINGNGTIHISPVWVSHDDAAILLNSVRGRQKDRNLRRRRQVSLLFVNPDDAYHWMSIQGEVIETIDEDDPERGNIVTASLDEMSQAYLGQTTYPLRDPAGDEVRSLYRVQPNKAQIFGGSSPA